MNLAILALIIAFFWYHQQVQDRIFDRIVNYHGAVARAAQASLTELHYISDELWRQASPRDNSDSPASPAPSALENIRSHLGALAEQKHTVSSIQKELPDPAFETATNAALQAFDPVLRIGTEKDPGRRNLSARLELIDELGARLRSLLALHTAEQDRLALSGPHSGLNHPEYLMLAIGFLTVFGLAAGFGVIRSVTAANLEREAAFSALVKSEKELAHLAAGLEAAQRIAHVGNWDWDRESGAEWWSDENYRIIGLEPGAAPATNETFYRTIHEDDRQKVAGVQD